MQWPQPKTVLNLQKGRRKSSAAVSPRSQQLDKDGHVYVLAIETHPVQSIAIWDITRMDCSCVSSVRGDAARAGHWALGAVAEFDSLLAVVATLDRSLQLWDLRQLGRPLASSDKGVFGERGTFLHAAELSSSSARVACCDSRGNIHLFNALAAAPESSKISLAKTLYGHVDEVRFASFDWGQHLADEIYATTLAVSGDVLQWGPFTWPPDEAPDESPDSSRAGSKFKTQKSLNFQQKKLMQEEADTREDGDRETVPRMLPFAETSKMRSMHFERRFESEDISLLTGCTDGSLHVWNIAESSVGEIGVVDGSPLLGHTDQISCIDADLQHRRAITGSLDRTLRIWDLDEHYPHCKCVLEGHAGSIRTLTADFCETRRALSSGADNELHIWDLDCDLEHGQKSKNACMLSKLEVPRETATAREVLVNFRGGRAALVTREGQLRVWDLETSKRIAFLEGHTNAVFCVQLGGTVTHKQRMTELFEGQHGGSSNSWYNPSRSAGLDSLFPTAMHVKDDGIVRSGGRGWSRSPW